MPRVILVNPALATIGYSFITPRWLFVLAEATPAEVDGQPVLVDETLERFRPEIVRPGDIVGIGISTGNCTAGYRVLRQAKSRGAIVIMGGIHATIFPDEPLAMGADAVVTGNGDLVWPQVLRDALEGRLESLYHGGRVPGDCLLKARWGLLDPARYLMPSVQTVAGCPENCSFCSVWVTDGRSPRLRHAERIIEEANELHRLGFRFIVFADDNFNPATLGRIAREPSPHKRAQLERVREERLRFFDQYGRSVPADLHAFTQMTSEVVTDEEYLTAMHDKMRVRTALVGIESFTAEGLDSVNKGWNPAGETMVETIRTIQKKGILVLSSVICGIESDTVTTIRAMSDFALRSGSILAQFTAYQPFPGTKDFHEMVADRRNAGAADSAPKRRIRLLIDRHWLEPVDPSQCVRHPNLTGDELMAERRRCWESFYSLRAILARTRGEIVHSWPLAGKLTYIVLSLVFKRVYGGNGMSADSVRSKRSAVTKLLVNAGAGLYSFYFRRRRITMRARVTLRSSHETG